MANLVGQYFGNQRVVRLLGRTTFAEVYLTEGSFPGDQRALKVLRVELSETEQEYFILASRAITDLVHPHIIRVAEIGIVENRFPFLFMEYAPNGTLRQRHPIGSQLPLTTVLPYIRHIAEALHYAHLQELTHGDIRPENILLGGDNQILVSDFSFALISPISSIKKIETSTTAYLAPEQIIGQPCPLSDEYALGVMVYEWLSGELPFSGSLSEIADQHLSAPPPPLHTKVPAISPGVEKVVLMALAKDPKSRFGNLLAFANALKQASQPAQPFSSAPFSLTGPSDSPSPTLADTPQDSPSSTRNVRAGVVSRRSVVGISRYSLSPTLADTPQGPPSLKRNARAAVVSRRSTVGIPRSSTRRLSRRAVIASLPVLVVAGGGIVAWLLTRREPSMITTRSHTLLTYRGHASEVTAVAWSPNGKYIASGGNDSTIRVWNTKTGADLLISHDHSGGVPAISWSPDSTRIASATAGPSVSGGSPASDNAVRVWNATTGKSIYIYHGHSSGITDVAWSPRDERIASSSTDYTVQVWDAATGKHPLIYRTHGWYIWTVAWSPEGKRLASGGPDGTIQIWDAVTGHTFHAYRGHVNGVEAVAWSPDGKYIASASDDHTVRLWNAATGKLIYIYRGHTSYVRAVAWSPDGHSIASGSSDKTVQVWDSATGRTSYTYHGHSGGVTTVVWSPDGHSIASGSEDGTAQLWQAP